MYEVEPIDGLGAVPADLLPALAEIRTALEVSPWTVGRAYRGSNPSGMRVASFGDGRALLVFGVSDQERSVWLFDLVIL